MTPELGEVLRLHGMWLRGESGGVRADLSGADLPGANLRGADLCHANLRDADLPAGFKIATLCFGGWPVTVTPEQTTIGCQTHPNDWWRGLEVYDRRLPTMGEGAPTWWRRHRAAVLAVIDDVEGSDD